jgi:hypothetical protein
MAIGPTGIAMPYPAMMPLSRASRDKLTTDHSLMITDALVYGLTYLCVRLTSEALCSQMTSIEILLRDEALVSEHVLAESP